MSDIIVVAIIVCIVGAAVRYIIKEKKRGVKCIGCPDGCTCAAKEAGIVNCCGGCSSMKKCND